MPLDLTITNEEKVKVTLAPVTSTNKPAKLDGTPEWVTISGPAKLEPASNGLSAYLISDDTNVSDSVFQVNADADLGEGTETISDLITLHVSNAHAKNLGIVAGQPEAK